MMMVHRKLIVIGIVCVAFAVGYYLAAAGGFGSDTAQADPSKASPVKALAEREVYYPGTEDLAPDEMRVTACGTGMPNARPKQAAACWLVELGNGDKFLFDIGTGSAERIAAMKIPYNYLNKVFIGHLHSDHFGDLDALYCGGIVANRVVPLRVWGPNSIEPKYGTKVAMEHFEGMLAWDIDTRMGNTDTRGAFLKVTEFDYKAVNKIIYEENGVTIRTIPAVHIFDGAVSFILEWNGLKFCYSSDTFPNKWWIEHTKGADISIHEAFITPESLVEKQGFTPEAALNVGTQIHTSPAQFGKVMAETKPRMAVGYHFFNDFDTAPQVLRDVRRTYDGPLALAVDYMVFNVTKEKIRVRMAAVDEDIWPQPSTIPLVPPDPSLQRTEMSKDMLSGRVVHKDILKEIYAEINEQYGSNAKVPE
ncbi:MAG: MBL fold metallo-hydrolase [Candidatus Latescibacterota bacterium]|nr:MAG: MBL fold metallo-hydrolase [Candidatus Latescibacterota bacterium]